MFFLQTANTILHIFKFQAFLELLTFNQRVRSSNLRWLTKTKISLFLKRNSEIFVYHKVLLVRLSHHSYAVQARSQGRCEDGSVIFRVYARRIDSSGPSLYFAFTGSKCPNCLFLHGGFDVLRFFRTLSEWIWFCPLFL